MTWARAPLAAALAAELDAALAAADLEATVFEKPPLTLNPSSLVIGRPSEVRYGVSSFGIDEADLPVAAVAGQDQDDQVSVLLELVRTTVNDSFNLGGACQQCHAVSERSWRHINVSGADLLAAEILLQILM